MQHDSNRQAGAEDQLTEEVITPQMLAAGADVIEEKAAYFSAETLASMIYIAMRAASGRAHRA